jgi:hypothetical protein
MGEKLGPADHADDVGKIDDAALSRFREVRERSGTQERDVHAGGIVFIASDTWISVKSATLIFAGS